MSPFIDSLHDLLSSLGEIHARRMFGGYGLYKDGLMFGIAGDDHLYLRTDDETKDAFIEHGCEPLVFGVRNGVEIVSKYYEPPESAFINAHKMKPWALLSWQATQRAPKKKPRARKKTSKPTPD
jgi:DNA transformation protein and related proteins